MDKRITLVSNIISTFPHVEKVILFGSRARGDANERSDIDLAILCPQASDKEWLAIWDAVETADTLLKIDIIRLDKADQALLDIIKNQGVLLYEK